MTDKNIPINLDDKEMVRLLKSIAEPSVKFFIKRMERELLSGYFKTMSVDCFITIFLSSMANIDGNLVRWLSAFYEEKTKRPAPFDKITEHFKSILQQHFETKIGKN
jgi:hypothetical protein